MFHIPGELEISAALRGSWYRPLVDLLIDANVLAYSNDVHTAMASFTGWCLSQNPVPVWFASVESLPGVPWKGEYRDAWSWYERVMLEVESRTPPPLLVNLEARVITHRGQVVWPAGVEGVERLAKHADRRVLVPGEPFSRGWYGQDLGEFRPGDNTYNCYRPDELPPIPIGLHGDFHWLNAAQSHHEPSAKGIENTDAALVSLRKTAPVPLPREFVSFFADPALRAKFRSCTDCYFHLDSGAAKIQGGLGYLVRFMADSQGCVYWSLYVSPCGTKQAVVTTYHFSGCESLTHSDIGVHPRDITICSDSFEEFAFWFWIENELWYHLNDDGVMPQYGEQYLAFYRTKPADTA